MSSSGEIEPVGSSVFHFPNFDVVTEFDDHHYFKPRHTKQRLHDENSPVYGTIMKEWRILQKNLPDSIYVRVFETRIDLLRAAITGAAGTPYHDGLFFFDIRLPSDYPRTPPKVHYRSYGYHLNPIISSNGKLCLSLITQRGNGTHKWTKASTILQLLVSIQGLVLNATPYFNVSHFDTDMNRQSRSSIRLSMAYNEYVFLQSCKTMIQIMKKPPNNFEDFVAQHFRLHSVSILAAIRDYQRGAALVGRVQTNATGSKSVTRIKVGSYFKTSLVKVEGELEKAFGRLSGVTEVEGVKSLNNGGKKEKHGFWKKLIQCISSM